MKQHIETNLATITALSTIREDENQSFRVFLKTKDSAEIDARVQKLNAAIEPQIDCTTCGNCCKTFMISVEPEELVPLANFLSQPLSQVTAKYVEQSSQGNCIINAIPCHFLSGNSCSVYEHRFNTCREFPHLHTPGFTNRLFSVVQHYGICPIVFNVVEQLKVELDFR